MAIICHECTHHFLNHYKIYLKNDNRNEILTDVAAVYIGFSTYLKKGYKNRTIKNSSFDTPVFENNISDIQNIENLFNASNSTSSTIIHKIGYISTFDIRKIKIMMFFSILKTKIKLFIKKLKHNLT